MGNCKYRYLAQAGTVTVTRADRSDVGSIALRVSNLKFLEWDFTPGMEKPVPGGTCYELTSASFDVSYGNATDGGLPPPDAAVPGCAPVVNELMTHGMSGGSDEFVEIFNDCDRAVDMNGWKLLYRSAGNNSGGASTQLFTFAQTLASKGYLLITGRSFIGTSDGVFVSGGLADAGGAVALQHVSGAIVDSVSYSTLSTANLFTEHAPTANPPQSKSIARFLDGFDSDDNSFDFEVKTPTPKAAN